MAAFECPHCKGQVYEELKVCPHCGAPVLAKGKERDMYTDEKKWYIFSLILSICAIGFDAWIFYTISANTVSWDEWMDQKLGLLYAIAIFATTSFFAGLYVGTFFYGWHYIAAERKTLLGKVVLGFFGAYLTLGVFIFLISTVRLLLKKPIISQNVASRRAMARLP